MQKSNTKFNTSSVDFDTKFNATSDDFTTEFVSIVASAVREEKQEKTIRITENGTHEVVPDKDKVLNKVTVVADVIGGNVEEYKGQYEVTPKVEEQTLLTAQKVMRNDIKIKEIPFFEVSNNSGGKTIFIGNEV